MVAPFGRLGSPGDLLRAARRRRDLTAEALAETLGVTVSTLVRWETGEASPREGWEAILQATGCEETTIRSLFDEPHWDDLSPIERARQLEQWPSVHLSELELAIQALLAGLGRELRQSWDPQRALVYSQASRFLSSVQVQQSRYAAARSSAERGLTLKPLYGPDEVDSLRCELLVLLTTPRRSDEAPGLRGGRASEIVRQCEALRRGGTEMVAILYLRDGLTGKALATLERALDQTPNADQTTDLRLNRAFVLANMGRLDIATEEAESLAIASDFARSKLWFEIGYRMEDDVRALTELRSMRKVRELTGAWAPDLNRKARQVVRRFQR